MTEIIVKLLTALLGTLCFSVIFRVSRSKLPLATLGGVLTYAIFELFNQLYASPMLAALAASLFMALYSELLARIMHSPAIVFLFPCAIPIVPGGGLYYTVYNLLFWNKEKFLDNAKSTAAIVLGMAVGVSVSTMLVGALSAAAKALRTRQK